MIKSWYSLAIILLALLPVPIFLNKLPSQAFIWSTFRLGFTDNFYVDKILSFPLYITIVPLIELMAIPIVLLITWRSLNKSEKLYVSASWVFFVSTYIIAYSGYNNYTTRGMFIPTFVFFFIFAQHWLEIMQYMKSKIKPALIFFILLLSITGTFKEFLGRTNEAIRNSCMLRSVFGMSELAFLNAPIYEIATDKNVDTINIRSYVRVERKNIYHYEKFIENLELADMVNWEKELLRRPWIELIR